jgi:beta-lactamase superfamily II metal-dependent hydrolase
MNKAMQYIAIIDVGHGNSTVIKDVSEVIIVDCGARGAGLLQFLEQEGIFEIDAVFLSHSDQDHIGGLIALISYAKFTIKSVYLNSDSSKGSRMWDDLVYSLSESNKIGSLKNFTVGLSRQLFKWTSISLDVVGPDKYLIAKGAGSTDRRGREITSNSMSASFKIKWEDKVIAYLAGDIDQVGLDILIDDKIDLNAQVLVFPHHGGKSGNYDITEFTRQLCSLVNPEVVLFSIGRNKHDNPKKEVIDAIRSLIPHASIGCTQLSKTCAKVLPTSLPSHLNNLFANGREKNQCCAGTFLIVMGEKIQYFPTQTAHLQFIQKFAPTCLCSVNSQLVTAVKNIP